MEETTYISVQELSNRTKKSIQSIYKRIKNKNDVIQSFLKRDNEGNILEPYQLNESIIDIVYNKKKSNTQLNSKPCLVEFRGEKTENEKKEEQTAYSKTFDILNEQLNLLREQLSAEREENQRKDNLIFELNQRIAESNKMLDQQQQLSLADKKRILELEGQQESQKTKRKKLFGIF